MEIKKGIQWLTTRIKRLIGQSKISGKSIILLGGRGCGKSETVKQVCRLLKGNKFIFEFNKDGEFTEINEKDEEEYRKIKDCILLEHCEENSDIENGLLVNEDFSKLTRDGEAKYLDLMKHLRHKGLNILIVTHSLKQIPDDILRISEILMLYKKAGITAQKLSTLITPKKAYAIKKALSDLDQYQYYFISLEDELWYKPTENRDVDIIDKYLKGKGKKYLQAIETKKETREDKRKKDAKTPKIKEAIKKGKNYTWIKQEYQTTNGYLRKLTSEMRTQGEQLPDRRTREWKKRQT